MFSEGLFLWQELFNLKAVCTLQQILFRDPHHFQDCIIFISYVFIYLFDVFICKFYLCETVSIYLLIYVVCVDFVSPNFFVLFKKDVFSSKILTFEMTTPTYPPIHSSPPFFSLALSLHTNLWLPKLLLHILGYLYMSSDLHWKEVWISEWHLKLYGTPHADGWPSQLTRREHSGFMTHSFAGLGLAGRSQNMIYQTLR